MSKTAVLPDPDHCESESMPSAQNLELHAVSAGGWDGTGLELELGLGSGLGLGAGPEQELEPQT